MNNLQLDLLRKQSNLDMNKIANMLEKTIFEKYEKKEEQRKAKQSQEAFFNPKDKFGYIGAQLVNNVKVPTWIHKVKDFAKQKMADVVLAKQGSMTALDAARYNPFTTDDGTGINWQEEAKQYFDIMEKIDKGELTMKQAGAMTQSDFTGMRMIQILGGLVNQEQRNYVLQTINTVPTTELMLRIPTVTRFQISQDVGEFDFVESMKMSFTQQYIQLRKDVAHLAWSDEFTMSTFDQPIYALHIQNANSEFERVKAQKVATQILGFTNTQAVAGGGTWYDFAAGTEHYAADPRKDFNTARTTIRTGFGVGNRAASNLYTYQGYEGNGYIQGVYAITPTQGTPSLQINQMTVTPPKLPGVTWYIDEEMTNGKVGFWDDSALVRLQGPIRSSTYREEHAGGNGIYIRDWNGAFTLRQAQCVLLTGAA
jgi:hypothetical protein